MLNSILPFMVLNELKKFALGEGQYRGLGGIERTGKLLERSVSGNPVYDNHCGRRARTGQGGSPAARRLSRVLALAVQEYPPPKFESREADEQDEKFRMAMMKAHRAVQQFKDPAPHIAAFGRGREGKNLAQSMRGRMMLTRDKLLAKTDADAEQHRRSCGSGSATRRTARGGMDCIRRV